jgi:hypothetical protein
MGGKIPKEINKIYKCKGKEVRFNAISWTVK